MPGFSSFYLCFLHGLLFHVSPLPAALTSVFKSRSFSGQFAHYLDAFFHASVTRLDGPRVNSWITPLDLGSLESDP